MKTTITFYFDFVSPYSYLAHTRLVRMIRQWPIALDYHVVDLDGLKLLARNTAPKTRQIPLKLRYGRIDLQRWAKRYGVPLSPPCAYGSTEINKGVFYAQKRGMAQEYVESVWTQVWGRGGAMSSESLLTDTTSSLQWDAASFKEYLACNEAEEAYLSNTLKAHDRGIFGVPTMAIDEQMWWGNDRLDFMEEELAERLSSTKSEQKQPA